MRMNVSSCLECFSNTIGFIAHWHLLPGQVLLVTSSFLELKRKMAGGLKRRILLGKTLAPWIFSMTCHELGSSNPFSDLNDAVPNLKDLPTVLNLVITQIPRPLHRLLTPGKMDGSYLDKMVCYHDVVILFWWWSDLDLMKKCGRYPWKMWKTIGFDPGPYL